MYVCVYFHTRVVFRSASVTPCSIKSDEIFARTLYATNGHSKMPTISHMLNLLVRDANR